MAKLSINKKKKGNRFENFVCKELSLFLTNNEHADLFQRSINSGGKQTVLNRNGKEFRNQAGDIAVNHSDGEEFLNIFCLECKHYIDIGLWSLFTENDGKNLYGWWTTHIQKSLEVNRHPILITKQNNRPILLFTDDITASALKSVYSIDFRLKINLTNSFDLNMNGYLFNDILPLNGSLMKNVYDLIRNGE